MNIEKRKYHNHNKIYLNKFLVLEKLGEGSYGNVYKV